MELCIGDLFKLLSHRADGAHGGQALLGIAPVNLQVQLDNTVQLVSCSHGQRSLFHQDLAKGLSLVKHPGVHGSDQCITIDEVHLHGQDAEQEVAVRVCTRRRHGRISPANPENDTPKFTA
jgi:hypothetical protein